MEQRAPRIEISSIPVALGAGVATRRNCSRMYRFSSVLTESQSRCSSLATS